MGAQGSFRYVGAAGVARADGMIKYAWEDTPPEWITPQEWARIAKERMHYLGIIRQLEAQIQSLQGG